MRFTKMQGIGNDYIYINGKQEKVSDPSELARKISDRHFGAGSDGLVILDCPSPDTVTMRMFNSDGSEGRMCGNAARCIGKYVYERGMTDRTDLLLKTASGDRGIHLEVEDGHVRNVRVDMGIAVFNRTLVPVLAPGPDSEPVRLEGMEEDLYCVSMGNPHCVIFIRHDPDDMNIQEPGMYLEHHRAFPEGVNVEFVQVIDPSHVKMRVWERGSGETLACGTGACAAVAAGIRSGKLEGKVEVRLRGGCLSVYMDKYGRVFQEGPAEFVYDGIWMN